MANIYETQRQQITQRANKQGQQDNEAMQRRFIAMGGGPGSGAQEKMIAKAAATRAAQTNEAIAGVDARQAQAQEEKDRQDAQNAFTASENQKGRDLQSSQFDRNLGFQTAQAKENSLFRDKDFAYRQKTDAERLAFDRENSAMNRKLEEEKMKKTGGLFGGGGFLGLGI